MSPGPLGLAGGEPGPFLKCLPEELGAGPTPVDPILFAAGLGDGRNARAALDLGGVRSGSGPFRMPRSGGEALHHRQSSNNRLGWVRLTLLLSLREL
jgi:hypothetical protein